MKLKGVSTIEFFAEIGDERSGTGKFQFFISNLKLLSRKKEDDIMWNTLFTRNTTTKKAIENISAVELSKMIQDDENILLLDVRTPPEYAQGHIAGSRLLPLSSLGNRINELPQDATIVCVCRSGARSMVACENLSRLGFENVYNLGNGMIGWQMAQLPISRN